MSPKKRLPYFFVFLAAPSGSALFRGLSKLKKLNILNILPYIINYLPPFADATCNCSSTTLEFSTFVKIFYFCLKKGFYTRLYPSAVLYISPGLVAEYKPVSFISPGLISEYKPVSAISPGLVDEHDFQFFGLLSIFCSPISPWGYRRGNRVRSKI